MSVRLLAAQVTTGIAASLPSFVLTLGAALILSSLGASSLMPAPTALVRDVRGEDDTPLAPQAVLLLIGLCGLAMLQVPGIVGWWRAEQEVLNSVLPERMDPPGFNYIVTAVAHALPLLASLTVTLFAITSLLGIVAPSKLAPRVIAAGVVLQFGYIAAIFLIAAETHTIGAALGPAVADDPGAQRTLADWMSAHDASGRPTTQWLASTSFGYLMAAAVTALSAKSWTDVPAGTTAIAAPPVVLEKPVSIPHLPVKSDASSSIDDSVYSVHPRMTLLEAWLTRKCTKYEIRSIPHTSRKWFTYSWTDGLLKQHPEGKHLAKIVPPSSPGLFWDRKYEVVDATGHTIARFSPRGQDWEITDPSDALIARVLRETSRDIVKFRAMIGETEVARFKWALAGLTAASAELEVEFLPSANAGHPSLDRLLVIAIAPILEQRSRLIAERSNR